MTDELSPKELARIKREGRAERIGRIRRRVLVLGATLAAVFSGVVLARTDINQPAAGSPAQSGSAPVQTETSDGFNSGDLGQAVAGIVTSALSASDDESPSSASTSPDSAPLTTSQS